MAHKSLAMQLANEAARTLTTVMETQYVHTIHINALKGIYDCDCSGYLEYLIDQTSLKHIQLIRNSTTRKRPLAADFHKFFVAQPTHMDKKVDGWIRVSRLADARRGDIISWSLTNSATRDTGHVVTVANDPVQVDEETLAVNVYDSSFIKHFDDSRIQGTSIHAGIGSGTLHFVVNAAGAPERFQFNETATSHKRPIAIARMLPFSSVEAHL